MSAHCQWCGYGHAIGVIVIDTAGHTEAVCQGCYRAECLAVAGGAL